MTSNKKMNQENMTEVKFIEGKDLFVVSQPDGPAYFISANLIRHKLGIPYTKKDGTEVSKRQIDASNDKARKAYIRRIEEGSRPSTTMRKAK